MDLLAKYICKLLKTDILAMTYATLDCQLHPPTCRRFFSAKALASGFHPSGCVSQPSFENLQNFQITQLPKSPSFDTA
jgi:hypothetical protein